MTTAVAEVEEVAEVQNSNGEAGDLFDGIDLGGSENAESPQISEESPTATTAELTPAEPSNPPDELTSLRQQLARLQETLSQREFADQEIERQSKRVRRLADEVDGHESAVKEVKADLTAAKERYETAVRELRSMIDDRVNGQRRLRLQGQVAVSTSPAEMTSCVITGETADAIPTDPAENSAVNADSKEDHSDSPISVLASKQMLAQFGQDAWQAAKDREEPFGLGKGELETLEAAEITTIGELEKKMRDDAYWHQKIPKFGEKKVAKLIESLRVWRGKFPMAEVAETAATAETNQ